METLKIKNVGIIKNLEIEIKPIMIFVGKLCSGRNTIMNQLMEKFKNDKKSHVIIEPERDLFPDEQRHYFNSLLLENFNHLILSTNSPYILNQINLLLKAHDKNNTDYTNGASINYDDLAVYYIKLGKVTDLKMKDKHFIDCIILSDDINDIYNKYELLDNQTATDSEK